MLLGGARGTFPGRLMWAHCVLFACHNTHCREADAASPGPGALGPGLPLGCGEVCQPLMQVCTSTSWWPGCRFPADLSLGTEEPSVLRQWPAEAKLLCLLSSPGSAGPCAWRAEHVTPSSANYTFWQRRQPGAISFASLCLLLAFRCQLITEPEERQPWRWQEAGQGCLHPKYHFCQTPALITPASVRPVSTLGMGRDL